MKKKATYKQVKPKGKCERCGRGMPPVGNSRKNGKNHNDWGDREYHKKCWRQMMIEKELENMIDDDE